MTVGRTRIACALLAMVAASALSLPPLRASGPGLKPGAYDLRPGPEPGAYDLRDLRPGLKPGAYDLRDLRPGLKPGAYDLCDLPPGLKPGAYDLRPGPEPGAYDLRDLRPGRYDLRDLRPWLKPDACDLRDVGPELQLGARQTATGAQQKPQQPGEVTLSITGSGNQVRLAVPDFLAQGMDPATVAAARTIAAVLWDDLQFEREFDLIPRDTYASIPPAKSPTDVPFDRWRELGADGVVVGSVQKSGNATRVEVRLYQVQTGRAVLSKEYEQSTSGTRAVNLRLFAHTISDEIFEQQRALKGVARTRIAFDSDRAGEQVTGTVQTRLAKEIYVCDYDGENQTRVTRNRNLDIAPAWSPDGRALAYTSWAAGNADVLVAMIYGGGPVRRPARGSQLVMNSLPAWSPDGTRLAFVSNRDGNNEIYIVNADGSGMQRLTRNPGIDSSPTWSPTGTQIAFVSDRSGSPQVYVMTADGLGQAEQMTHESYCDRPTWSPAPYNEIAFTARTAPNVFDIKVIDLGSGKIRQLTSGGSHNESPAYAPNGRHLAFMSNRTGRYQIYTIDRAGRDLRQITTAGSNFMPNWSR